jgi:hypothetical protein
MLIFGIKYRVGKPNVSKLSDLIGLLGELFESDWRGSVVQQMPCQSIE